MNPTSTTQMAGVKGMISKSLFGKKKKTVKRVPKVAPTLPVAPAPPVGISVGMPGLTK